MFLIRTERIFLYSIDLDFLFLFISMEIIKMFVPKQTGKALSFRN